MYDKHKIRAEQSLRGNLTDAERKELIRRSELPNGFATQSKKDAKSKALKNVKNQYKKGKGGRIICPTCGGYHKGGHSTPAQEKKHSEAEKEHAKYDY